MLDLPVTTGKYKHALLRLVLLGLIAMPQFTEKLKEACLIEEDGTPDAHSTAITRSRSPHGNVTWSGVPENIHPLLLVAAGRVQPKPQT